MRNKNFLLATLLGISSLHAQQTIFSDSFENCTSFAKTTATNECGWTFIDQDASPNVHSIMEANFTGNDSTPSSFIVMDAQGLTPDFNAQQGRKYMANFANFGNNQGFTPNNDWLISPQIRLHANHNQVRFWVKELNAMYPGNSEIYVGVSTSNTNAASFTRVNASAITPNSNQWTEYAMNLPATYNDQNVFISLNVTSSRYFLMVDNFMVLGSNQAFLSTSDVAKTEKFSLSPNPTSKNLFVNGLEGEATYSIISQAGESLKTGKTTANEAINVEDLAKGVYILQIKNGKEVMSRNFIKN